MNRREMMLGATALLGGVGVPGSGDRAEHFDGPEIPEGRVALWVTACGGQSNTEDGYRKTVAMAEAARSAGFELLGIHSVVDVTTKVLVRKEMTESEATTITDGIYAGDDVLPWCENFVKAFWVEWPGAYPRRQRKHVSEVEEPPKMERP